MINILPQESLEICFDPLAGSIRPLWEKGPNNFFWRTKTQKIRGIREVSTAIHIHIFYLDQVNEILDKCKNIQNRFYLLNTNSEGKAKVIKKILGLRGETHYEIRIFPNRGRDIASLLVGWRDRLEDFELLIHCHTKKTPHAPNGFGEAWRESLMMGTFPDERTCLQFQKLLSDPNSGILMPWPHRVIAHNVNWGRNFTQVRNLMKLMGHKISRETLLAFPAGSYFWSRISCLKPLIALELRWEDFAEEPLPGDGCLAHALERCLGLLPMLNQNNCYVHWAGRRCHDLNEGHEESALIPLPKPDDMNNHSRTWFRMGWLGAVEAQKLSKESIPLGRRLPGLNKRDRQQQQVNFMIAGTQKAGTTALAEYLRKHPQVKLPFQKELHFFDDEEQGWPDIDIEKLHESFRDAKPGQLWGDATPITMYWEPCAERIWRYNPAMQIIVILRDPVDRAYSHWAMETKRGLETLPFDEAIRLEEERARTTLPLQDRMHSYLDRGRYSGQIRRLWRWFGKTNVLILKQENLMTRPQSTLNKVYEFLSIEQKNLDEFITANQGDYKKKLDRSMRKKLIERMRGEILSLQEMLEWDCTDWLETER